MLGYILAYGSMLWVAAPLLIGRELKFMPVAAAGFPKFMPVACGLGGLNMFCCTLGTLLLAFDCCVYGYDYGAWGGNAGG